MKTGDKIVFIKEPNTLPEKEFGAWGKIQGSLHNFGLELMTPYEVTGLYNGSTPTTGEANFVQIKGFSHYYFPISCVMPFEDSKTKESISSSSSNFKPGDIIIPNTASSEWKSSWNHQITDVKYGIITKKSSSPGWWIVEWALTSGTNRIGYGYPEAALMRFEKPEVKKEPVKTPLTFSKGDICVVKQVSGDVPIGVGAIVKINTSLLGYSLHGAYWSVTLVNGDVLNVYCQDLVPADVADVMRLPDSAFKKPEPLKSPTPSKEWEPDFGVGDTVERFRDPTSQEWKGIGACICPKLGDKFIVTRIRKYKELSTGIANWGIEIKGNSYTFPAACFRETEAEIVKEAPKSSIPFGKGDIVVITQDTSDHKYPLGQVVHVADGTEYGYGSSKYIKVEDAKGVRREAYLKDLRPATYEESLSYNASKPVSGYTGPGPTSQENEPAKKQGKFIKGDILVVTANRSDHAIPLCKVVTATSNSFYSGMGFWGVMVSVEGRMCETLVEDAELRHPTTAELEEYLKGSTIKSVRKEMDSMKYPATAECFKEAPLIIINSDENVKLIAVSESKVPLIKF